MSLSIHPNFLPFWPKSAATVTAAVASATLAAPHRRNPSGSGYAGHHEAVSGTSKV